MGRFLFCLFFLFFCSLFLFLFCQSDAGCDWTRRNGNEVELIFAPADRVEFVDTPTGFLFFFFFFFFFFSFSRFLLFSSFFCSSSASLTRFFYRVFVPSLERVTEESRYRFRPDWLRSKRIDRRRGSERKKKDTLPCFFLFAYRVLPTDEQTLRPLDTVVAVTGIFF